MGRRKVTCRGRARITGPQVKPTMDKGSQPRGITAGALKCMQGLQAQPDLAAFFLKGMRAKHIVLKLHVELRQVSTDESGHHI